MDNIDFAALPDAEAARLMAERDGWKPCTVCRTCLKTFEGHIDLDCDGLGVCNPLHKQPENYPRSLDAAVGWLGRMGLEWRRTFDVEERVYCIEVYDSIVWRACEESPDCPTARALCNAGWAAVQAREAANGN